MLILAYCAGASDKRGPPSVRQQRVRLPQTPALYQAAPCGPGPPPKLDRGLSETRVFPPQKHTRFSCCTLWGPALAKRGHWAAQTWIKRRRREKKKKKQKTKRKKKHNKTARYSSNPRRFKLPHGQKFYLRMEQKANMPPNWALCLFFKCQSENPAPPTRTPHFEEDSALISRRCRC